MSIKQNGSFTDKNKQVKQKAKKVNDFSENFDPPDGGWGWIIVMAAGFSNFCVLPVMQSFGLIFRDRFADLGINSTQITTILNINFAVYYCIGLANGPLFRKFSYRQISFIGATVSAVSITILSTMKSFAGILIFFSLFYAAGTGITMSSNALALNTYFKKKRRIATGLSWTCTGMGPIVMPQIITLLMPKYGMEGTVLIFGGFAFNAVACSLLLQPVSLHVRKKQNTETLLNNENVKLEEFPIVNKVVAETIPENYESSYQSDMLENTDNTQKYNSTLNITKGKFGSQFLYYDDEESSILNIDIISPETPMMSRANDGWFSRKNTSSTSITSKSSKKEISSRNPSRRASVNLSRQSSLNRRLPIKDVIRQTNESEKSRRKISDCQSSMVPLIVANEHAKDLEGGKDSNYNQKPERKLIASEDVDVPSNEDSMEEIMAKKTFLEKFIIFFDLDLLRDFVYVNIMLGITFANFSEMNFSLLTPFILSEYGFSKNRVATVMSILAGFDVAGRLVIPFIADCIGWQNRTFFLVGICGLAMGRIVMAHVHDFGVILAVLVLIGVGKGFRTIFMALVIPSHVPLSKLPGATGIQLLVSGLTSLMLGPLIGWIRDITLDYGAMLHCLNVFTFLTTISWLLEMHFTRRKLKKAAQEEEATNKLNV
ncbi:unnamed protein product [Xylocopa violacea]|uniref:Major facilitator superfamily (MFS) profile domain-containing protein n=1 Tax=Xylocopa violacea TaxID=135666 RepID=A0ABP1N062_XYLVO